MNRFWLGVGLLLALLGLGLYSAHVMEETNLPIAQTLEQAAQYAQDGQLDRGAALLEQARQQWDSRWHSTAVLADHSPLDDIDSLFAQAKAYAQAGQSGDFAAFCMRLSQLIEATSESHSANWWNFL